MERNTFIDKNPVARLFLSIAVAFTVMLILMAIAMYFSKYFFGPNASDLNSLMDLSDSSKVNILKYYQIVQTVGLFLIPAIFLAGLFSGSITNHLYLNKSPRLNQYLLVIILMLSAIPLINLMAYLNEHIRLPSFMAGLERTFVYAEKSAEKETLAFMATKTFQGLALNIIMIGILPAVAEELMFRGILQRIFTDMTKNAHWGILISSFIFSAIHLQFYGFFPRWILGLLFGYLLFWSGSMWVPILAHFINNTVAVLVYFFVNTGKMNEKSLEVGAPNAMIVYSILALFIFTGCIYLFYKENRKLSTNNLSEKYKY